MKVSFLDLQKAYQSSQDEIEAEILRSLRSGRYIGGEDLSSFEDDFAAFTNAKHCIGFGNGLDALFCSLLALGIGSGDEVLVPSHTFIATWLAVTRCGAIPVPVEPDELSFNISVEKIEAALTNKTRAIIPVHLYGQPADLQGVLDIASNHGLLVIDDAAQAHGAHFKNKPIGSLCDATAWSFYPGKNLGALGDAGAVTTNNSELASRLRALGNYGSHKRYVNNLKGFNSRLDPIQSAVLKVRLKKLSQLNRRRADIAGRYNDGLDKSGLLLPILSNVEVSVWHLYCVRHVKRDAIQSQLLDNEIETLIHYPIPPHLQLAFKDLGYRRGCFPIAENMADTLLSLPIDPMMSDAQVDFVIEKVNRVMKGLSDV
jgi:dTDP-4-amino-4,6-dideoxygalactose transaminase